MEKYFLKTLDKYIWSCYNIDTVKNTKQQKKRKDV